MRQFVDTYIDNGIIVNFKPKAFSSSHLSNLRICRRSLLFITVTEESLNFGVFVEL